MSQGGNEKECLSHRILLHQPQQAAMQPTLARWIRIVPKTTLAKEKVLLALSRGQSKNRTSVLDHLLEQKAAAGESWPRNIRMETIVKKTALQRVQADVRTRLKKLLRET